ncbi:MAG: ImmA/IrrE family metallo-endopeptidase, partial [Bacteroidetes bacterium]|nr:ImmA/IrrE family metallo-endopeptidase [Bacteroidota bacterium]
MIVKDGLDAYPDLKVLRSVFIPKNKKLLLNSELSEMQRAFQFGKELGFNHLKLKERANTSSVRRPNSFQEVLNHSKAIYFSTALLLNRERLIAHLKHFFAQPTWEQQAFLNIMYQYAASPEMYYHRLTSLLPQFFNLKKLFFIRFIHDLQQDTFEIDR